MRDTDERRRLRRVQFHPQCIVDLFKHGSPAVEILANPLPDDATFVHATYDHERDCLWLFVESASFDEIADGHIVPVHPDPCLGSPV